MGENVDGKTSLEGNDSSSICYVPGNIFGLTSSQWCPQQTVVPTADRCLAGRWWELYCHHETSIEPARLLPTKRDLFRVREPIFVASEPILQNPSRSGRKYVLLLVWFVFFLELIFFLEPFLLENASLSRLRLEAVP